MALPPLILPRDLPSQPSPVDTSVLVVDDGVEVRKTTIAAAAQAGIPVASQAEALAGADNAKRMTPLRTKQAIDALGQGYVDKARAWAEGTQPDGAGTYSSKEWAAMSADLAGGWALPYASFAEMVIAQDEGRIEPRVNRVGFVDAAGRTHWFTRLPGATSVADMPGWEPDGVRTPQHYGAGGIGLSNDTAAMMDFMAGGGGEIIAGLYRCDDIVISSRVEVILHDGATLLKRSGDTMNSTCLRFAPGAEQSSWVGGGVIDGNRGALQPSYDALNAALPSAYLLGWFGVRIDCAMVTFRDTIIRDHCAYPLICPGDDAVVENIRAEGCGAAIMFGYRSFSSTGFVPRPSGAGGMRQRVRSVHAVDTDNRGSRLLQHGIDVMSAADGSYADLMVSGLGGDVYGVSGWASGITIEDCDGCVFDTPLAVDFVSDLLVHLGLSLLGNRDCILRSPAAVNLAGVGLELNGNRNVIIQEPRLDGGYAATTAVPLHDGSGVGLTWYKGAWDGWRTSKSAAGNVNCKIVGGAICRWTRGGLMRDNDHVVDGTAIYGNYLEGLNVLRQASGDWFPGEQPQALRSTIMNCDIYANGQSGVLGSNYTRLTLAGCRIYNNGQRGAAASLSNRAGVTLNTGDHADLDIDCYDDQDWTLVHGASFQPGTSGDTHVFWVLDKGRIAVGQRLRLVGASTEGDIVGRVIDQGSDDTLTIRTDAPATLTSVGNTTGLTGSWSGNGLTLSGVGGAAAAEITGTVWITDGAEWRRVRRVSGPNSMLIDAPFSTALIGASLSVVRVDVKAIKSQQYGLRAFGAAQDIFVSPSCSFAGAEIEATLISSPGNLRLGSEYERLTVTTPTLANQNLQNNIPESHILTGVAARVDADISGAASWSLVVSGDPGLVTVQTIASGLALTKNTKVQGAGNYGGSHTKYAVRALFAGGAPSGGSVTCIARYAVKVPPALGDVP